ncbi:MAG: SHOCT domain-containing protein [Ruminococcus sp.]|nr:SHOCT domain-containing protein [Candidatus Apopatosoma intestinale]
MENNERILAKADVKYTPNKKFIKIVTNIWLIAAAVVIIVGFISGSYSYDGRFNLSCFFYLLTFEEGMPMEVYGFGVFMFSVIFIPALALPFCVNACLNAIRKRQCKNTELYVSESYVYGSYSGFLSKKSLKMPIEKVDNLTNASTFKDKLRSGTTIGVCSASGIIRFHFVQNAEEVITAAMNRINELKTAPKAAPASSASTSDKLKELLSLKESGLITEEEFSAKKTELLTKM